MKTMRYSVCSMLLVVGLVGCGDGDDLCREAAEHMNQCLHQQAVSAPQVCDPDTASMVLSMDCNELRGSMLSGKSDGFWSDLFGDWFIDNGEEPVEGENEAHEKTCEEKLDDYQQWVEEYREWYNRWSW